MGTRLVVLLIVALVIAYLVSSALQRLRRGLAELLHPPAPEASTDRRRDRRSVQLVECSRCGVHFPRSGAVAQRAREGVFYCSEECRRLVAGKASR